MSRVHLQVPTRTVVDDFLKVAPNVDVEIREVATDALATVYAADTGGATLTQPLTSDADGELEVILDPGSYYAQPPVGAPPDEQFTPLRFDTSTGPPGPQGPAGGSGGAGPAGPTGPAGREAGIFYTFDSGTGSGPGPGELRLNHATPASVTSIYVSEADAAANDVSTYLSAIDDSTSAIRGQLIIRSSSGALAIYNLTGPVVDAGTYRTLPVAHVAGTGPFADGDAISLSFFRVGDAGAVGPTGATGASGTGLSEKQAGSRNSDVAIGTSVGDVTGLTVTFTAGSRPILLRALLPLVETGATAGATVQWLITDSANNVQDSGYSCSGPALLGVCRDGATVVEARLGALTNGVSYTFKVRAIGFVASTLKASATQLPKLQALEV
jgi:hypothetical protein